MTKSRKKLIVLVVILTLIVISILLVVFSIFFNKTNEIALETYTLNKQGLLKNENTILNEIFDEKGNLLYYKYKSPDHNDILEFNYKYTYDNNNRITEVSLNDEDYIHIEYDENNKISKMNEIISNSLSNNKDSIQFSFNYLSNDEIVVDKYITNSKGTENEYTQHYTLNYKDTDYNNKKCILLTEKNNEGVIIFDVLYEKNENNINYSNFYELINIIPLGYSSIDHSFKDTKTYENSLLLMYPVFSNGNIIYLNNYLKATPYSDYTNMKTNNYYDNSNRLLKQESSDYGTNQTIYCMYKSINSREYYEYRIVKAYSNLSTDYKYIQNRIYLDDNNKVIKMETLKSNKIDEKEYTHKLKKFLEYFEKENITK